MRDRDDHGRLGSEDGRVEKVRHGRSVEAGQRRTRRTVAAVLAPTLAVLLLAGCANGHQETERPEVRIAQMKRAAQQAETTVAGFVPAEDSTGIEQLEEGSFLSCPGGFVWSGNTKVSLADGVDGKTAQAAIAEQTADEGYGVHRDRLLRGGTRYEIVTPGGVRLLVTVFPSGRLVDIDSFSPCSSFPNDYEPPEVY